MRVLHVFNRHRGGGGADNATDATIGLLREKGVDLRVLSYDSGDLPPGLRGKWRAFSGGVYAHGPIRQIAGQIQEFRPDVVHVYELYPLISPWILPECHRRGVPVVMTCYDYRLSCPVATHFRDGEICTRCTGGHEHRAAIHNCRGQLAESVAFALRSTVARRFELFRKHVSRFITPTQFAAEWLVKHAQLPAEKMVVIPCLIEMPETTVDPSEGHYVGFAGRFVPEKGIDVVVRAVRRAGLPLVVALDAPATYPLRDGDDVEIIVTRGPEELADFYRKARVFVMPSIWFESFGIVAAEAMSHGVPVIASRIGALAEVSQHGITGFLCEPGDDAELALRLRELWDDAELCRKLGEGARKRIETLTDREAHFERLRIVYEELAASPP